MTAGAKRKVSRSNPKQTISTDHFQRTDSPSTHSSHSSSNTHSTTANQPAPLSNQPIFPSLPQSLNSPSHLTLLNSAPLPNGPKQPSFPIRSASKFPSKVARLATKDEEEEDPLALLERHVDEYAARLKREANS